MITNFTNKYRLLRFLICITCLFVSTSTFASHIVGGELYYKHLGGNKYRITLTVYRDCSGSGHPEFDAPAWLGRFDGITNALIDTIALEYKGKTTMPTILSNPCSKLTNPGSVCYETTTYDTVLTFPNRPGGYQMAYQRCCRNATILNIPTPGSIGATYYGRIPDMTTFPIESNPVFKNPVPTFTCAGIPFTYDMSATDADGDSLVYELCDAFIGADNVNSQPTVPSNPPYSAVPWQAPYSLSNLLGGSPLTIDSKTGIMSAIPNTIGQFVVAVRVKSYRHGVYVSETHREFQLNVTSCKSEVDVDMDVKSSDVVLTPKPNLAVGFCGVQTVFFKNKSDTTESVAYTWDFGVIPSSTDTSTRITPTYTYPDTGLYHVRLVGIKKKVIECYDTAYADVRIFPKTNAEFGYKKTSGCSGSVQFTDSSSIAGISGNKYFWNFGDGTATSTLENPNHTYASSGTYTVTFIATSPANCGDTIIKTIKITLVPPTDAGPDKAICSAASTSIGTSGDPKYTYSWFPLTGLGFPLSPTTTVTPTATTTYILTVKEGLICSGKDTVIVKVNPLPTANAGSDKTICIKGSTNLGVAGQPQTSYQWTPVTALSDPKISNPVASPTSTTVYGLVVTNDTSGCSRTDSVKVTVNGPIYTLGNSKGLCIGSSTNIGMTDNINYSYSWSPSTGLNSTTISDPLTTTTATITYRVTITEITTSCFLKDSVILKVNPLPIPEAGPDQIKCQNDTIIVGNVSNTGYTCSWTPAANVFTPTSPTPQVGTDADRTYFLSVTDNNNCQASDSVHIKIKPIPAADPGADRMICSGTGTNLGIPGNGTYTYTWNPGKTLSDSTISNPTATPTVTTSYRLTVYNTLNYCRNVASVNIQVMPLPTISSGPDKGICIGEATTLGTVNNSLYTYSWSPGVTLYDSTIAVPTANPTITTTYILTSNYQGLLCTAKDTVILGVYAPPVAAAGIDQSICISTTTTIGAPSRPDYTYEWNPKTNLNDPYSSEPTVTPVANATYILTTTQRFGGCSRNDTMRINVVTPIANAGPDKVRCSNAAVTIGTTNDPNLNYEWTPSIGLNNSTIYNPVATPSANTTYALKVIDKTIGCIALDTMKVNIAAAPIADAGLSDTICPGNSAQLTALNLTGNKYTWSPGATLSNVNIYNPIASPLVSTKYYLNVLNTNTCSNIDSVTIVVLPRPNVDAGRDTAICIGNSVQIGTTGTSGYIYNWRYNLELSDSLIDIPTAKPVANATYYLLVTNPLNGCVNEDSIHVNINNLPIADAGINDTICKGLNLNVSAYFDVNYTYSWTSVGGDSFLTDTKNVIFNNSDTYFLVVTDQFNCVNKDTVKFEVIDYPIADAGPDRTICKGDFVSIGTSPFLGNSYIWSPANFLNNSTISQPVAHPQINTRYYLTVTEITGHCFKKDSMDFTVNIPVVSAGPDVTICNGSKTTIGSGALANYEYNWSPKKGLNDSTLANPEANPTITSSYYLFVKDNATACTGKDTVIVSVNTLSPVDAGKDTVLCEGKSYKLGLRPANNPAYLYTWAPPATLTSPSASNPVATPLTSTWYKVSIHDNLTTCSLIDSVHITVDTLPKVNAGLDKLICKSDTVQIGSTGKLGYKYLWTPGIGLKDSTLSQPKASPTKLTSYNLKVTELLTGCSSNDIVIIDVAFSNISLADSFKICKYSSVRLNPGGDPNYIYAWTPSSSLDNGTFVDPKATPASTTTYAAIITKLNSAGKLCRLNDTVVVKVSKDSLHLNLGNDIALCKGKSILLKAKTGGNPSRLIWYNISNSTDTLNPGKTDTTLLVSPTSGTITYVVHSENEYCNKNDTVSVNVDEVKIKALNDISICLGYPSSPVSAINLGLQKNTYSWSPSIGLIQGSSDSIVIANPSVTTTYSVLATDINNCVDTAAFIVTVNQLNGIGVGADSKVIFKDQKTILHGYPVGNYSYNWSPFVPLDDNTLKDPTGGPQQTTLFNLKVTDNITGCFANDTITITVKERGGCGEESIFIPNAFTPDGDNTNDVLFVRGNNVRELSMVIYNRWGELVKEINHQSDGWDGTYKGLPAEPGVYVYYVKSTCFDNETFTKKGNITLLR